MFNGIGQTETEWQDMVYLDWLQVGAETVSTVFLNLVKSLLAPLLVGMILTSVGRASRDASLGRVGLWAVVYFEVVTSVALGIGWAVMAWFRPGVGLGRASAAAVAGGPGLAEALVQAVPSSILEAMSRNSVLPILIFCGLAGWAARSVGEKAAGFLEFCESLREVMLGYARIVMKLAPYGMVGALLAVMLGGGWKSVGSLAGFVLAAVVAQLSMVVVYLVVLVGFGIPVGRFLGATRAAVGIAIATTASAAALPKALEGMEKFGVSRELLGLVMPLGLSFNLAGSNIQLMMGVMFVAQAAGVELGWGQLAVVFLTLKLAAKGVAGIPRANFVILSASLPGFGLPLDTLPLLLAVDGMIDMVRTPVNVLGNCLAPAVLARVVGRVDG